MARAREPRYHVSWRILIVAVRASCSSPLTLHTLSRFAMQYVTRRQAKRQCTELTPCRGYVRITWARFAACNIFEARKFRKTRNPSLGERGIENHRIETANYFRSGRLFFCSDLKFSVTLNSSGFNSVNFMIWMILKIFRFVGKIRI